MNLHQWLYNNALYIFFGSFTYSVSETAIKVSNTFSGGISVSSTNKLWWMLIKDELI